LLLLFVIFKLNVLYFQRRCVLGRYRNVIIIVVVAAAEIFP